METRDIVDMLAIAGITIFTITKLVSSMTSGLKEADAEVEAEREKLIDLQRKTIDHMSSQVNKNGESLEKILEDMDVLASRVDRLVQWLSLLACMNAPTCERRDCPNRDIIDGIIDGDILNVEQLKNGYSSTG